MHHALIQIMPEKNNLYSYISHMKREAGSYLKDALLNNNALRTSVLILIKFLTYEDKLREVYII